MKTTKEQKEAWERYFGEPAVDEYGEQYVPEASPSYTRGWRDGQFAISDRRMKDWVKITEEKKVLDDEIKALKSYNSELITQKKATAKLLDISENKRISEDEARAAGVLEGIIYSIIAVLFTALLIMIATFYI